LERFFRAEVEIRQAVRHVFEERSEGGRKNGGRGEGENPVLPATIDCLYRRFWMEEKVVAARNEKKEEGRRRTGRTGILKKWCQTKLKSLSSSPTHLHMNTEHLV
jgi:hypothetical protein